MAMRRAFDPFATSAQGRPGRTAAAVAAIVALVLTACGQKPGVHVDGGPGVGGALAAPASAPGAPSGGDGSTATAADAGMETSVDGTAPASGSSTASAPGSAAPTSTSGGSQTPSGSAPSSGTTAAAPAGSTESQPAGSGGLRPVRGQNRTGLTADTIILGTHAPVTGAAPLPVTSFEKSSDLYWKSIFDAGGDVLGRTSVEMIFRDDRYDPSAARQVCREMEAEVFTFAGGGGTDQIQACGAFAERAEVPYFSAGVTEEGLRGNSWYFASSMSYAQQGPLLAQLVKTNADTAGRRVGAIITDTPNFDDAVAGWEAGVSASGLDYYKTLRHPKGDTSWYNSYIADMADNGVEVIYILTAPVDYIRFAQQAQQAGITFQYVGVGVSMGLNAVLGSGCGTTGVVDGGIFFSPFPGLDWAAENVPQFFEAGQKYNAPTDDIALALWGANATLHALFEEYRVTYGNDLTREDFRDLVENASVTTNLFPAVTYTPTDHFGARTVHVLQADCETKQYKTIKTFASAF